MMADDHPEKKEFSKGEKKYKIEYDREGCIGAAACCAVSPDNWVMNEDGKADLLQKEIGEDRLEETKESAEVCPVRVILVKEKATGKQLAPE
jgi:ferredoxin